ncbi:MAG TPA: cytochrome P450 [Thermoanaerobaculia bacterium]|nr:cytochrome P450 [Thermoanaerobaculia bacterium]
MTLFARVRRKLRALAKRRRNPPAPLPASAGASAIDLDAAEIARDPFPHYDALRAKGPVQFLERHGAWLVLGHDEVQWAFTRPDLLSNRPYEDVDAVLLAADPPEHTAVRRTLNSYFARDVIERLGAFAGEYAASLLLARVDAVAGYGRPVSEAVAARLLGFDDAEVEALRDAGAHSADFGDYVRKIDALAHRAAMYERLRGDGFDEPRARSLVRLFWVASTATTERVIAQCVLALLQHPHARAAVERDPSLLAPFIEEVMRMHQPEPMLRRLATGDVELGGARIPAGALVYLSLAAANRDPRRYESPNELRLDRGASRHLTFGHGIHYCIGATLGRATVTAAMRTLLAQAPDFRAAQPLESVRHCATMMAHYVESLTIETRRAR